MQLYKAIKRKLIHESYLTPSDSAVWGIKELPGLMIGKISSAGMLTSKWKPARGWSVYLIQFGSTGQSQQVGAVLKGQEFTTRRDALQAVQVAWDTLPEEAG